ncbi:hypothetical protein ACOSP7_016980 [Xanthoceras sorbifolium]
MNYKFSFMIDRYKHQQLRIGSISPQQISAWTNKILPNGDIVREVTKPYTFLTKSINRKNKVYFVKEFLGQLKVKFVLVENQVIGDEKEDLQFCGQCVVEFVDYHIQRYQMGYIKLGYPITHVWYLKRLTSYIVNFLDKPLK